tara:strand:- start:1468 stop:1650 length:183 start_codon:yes stop_codon:yes gene_type:complete
MIIVIRGFLKLSETKQYKPGDKPTHFDKETAQSLVDSGFAEYIEAPKKENKKRKVKLEKK